MSQTQEKSRVLCGGLKLATDVLCGKKGQSLQGCSRWTLAGPKLPLAGTKAGMMLFDCYTRCLMIVLAGLSPNVSSNKPFVPSSTVAGSMVCGTAFGKRRVTTTARMARYCIFGIKGWKVMGTGCVSVVFCWTMV